MATLVPASAFPSERDEIDGFFTALTAWRGGELGLSQEALAEARRLVSSEWTERPPRVIDPFMGAGTIPLEVLRLGGEAAGVELNPVAFMVAMGTVVWPQLYGASLADDVKVWGEWVRERTSDEVTDLYPPLKLGSDGDVGQLDIEGQETTSSVVPAAYFWARTVQCPNPVLDPHQVPLLRLSHVARTARKRIAVRVVPDSASGRFDFQLSPETPGGSAARRGKSSASACQLCGAPISAEYLKRQGDLGRIGQQLVAVVLTQPGRQGKQYLAAGSVTGVVPDTSVLEDRLARLASEGLSPPTDAIQPMGNAGLASGETYLYGIKTFEDIFTSRQLVTVLTLCKYVREARKRMADGGVDADRADSIAAYLGMIVSRVVDRSTALCRWHPSEKVESPFVRDRLAMVWDFVEVNPFGGISGDYTSAMDSVCKVIRHGARIDRPAELRRGTATDLPFEDSSFDAAIIDPPYYDNISYANSSDFYYVWLKRSVGDLFPEHFSGSVAPKRREIVAAAYRHDKDKKAAAREYEQLMTDAFAELRRVLRPKAPLVVVYAHQTTAGWSTLIESLRSSGFTVVEAWPVDTEMAERRGGQENASLASSIFLVARRREGTPSGSWNEVANELRSIVAERVETLPSMGITGPDLVIATIAAGLRPYTRYVSVEKPNGEELPPEEYLHEVEREVAEAVLQRIFQTDRRGLGRVDPETQFYVMGRFEFGDALGPWDELNTLARGMGVELGELSRGAKALVAFGEKRDEIRLRNFRDRGSNDELGLDGMRSTIDHLHRVLWLAESEPHRLKDYLAVARPDAEGLRLVAHALARPGLDSSPGRSAEAEACERLLGVWRRLVEDNLFTQA